MIHSTGRLVFLLMVLMPVTSFGQTSPARRAMSTQSPESYAIPGSHLLQEENKRVSEYVAQHPDALIQRKLMKSAWTFDVGTAHTWKAWDFDTESYYDVSSTCRAVGTHCYVFVEDSLWGTRANQSAVDAVVNAFDNSTPANAAKGIYQMDVETFGVPPDVDGDPRIIILILDVIDMYSGPGSPYVAGFFASINEFNHANSNRAEIYYVDANPLNLLDPSGVTRAMSTAAHEFQHMIHFGKDSGEGTFINEGCSCFAESNCGYGIYNQAGYVNETNHSLLDWRGNGDPLVINDYSRASRFMQYIGDQIGAGVFLQIVSSPLKDLAGLDAALLNFGSARRFADIFPDWLVANILDDRTVNANYGYVYEDLLKAVGTTHAYPVVPLTQGTVNVLAADYISYNGGADLRVTFTTASPSLVIKAVEIGTPSRVVDVTPGVEFHEPGFGSTYSAIHFVVMNTSQNGSVAYSYQSSGSGSASVELKYDHSEPTTYYDFQAGDTACVWFKGVPGTRLDSLRVALHRQGSINGGVYRFTGAQRPTPLGAKLIHPVTATRSASSIWAKVDLRSYGIDAGTDFAVGFSYAGTASTDPRIAGVDGPYASASDIHSYVYLQEASLPDWYVIGGADTALAFSIRAYLSYGSTAAEEPAELHPIATRLEQNYPNPFNPKTGVRFQVSGVSEVKLVVYDLLGREVATLVDEQKAPGSYEVSFDGSGLASGVYIYRLTTGSFVATKQMVLVK